MTFPIKPTGLGAPVTDHCCCVKTNGASHFKNVFDGKVEKQSLQNSHAPQQSNIQQSAPGYYGPLASKDTGHLLNQITHLLKQLLSTLQKGGGLTEGNVRPLLNQFNNVTQQLGHNHAHHGHTNVGSPIIGYGSSSAGGYSQYPTPGNSAGFHHQTPLAPLSSGHQNHAHGGNFQTHQPLGPNVNHLRGGANTHLAHGHNGSHHNAGSHAIGIPANNAHNLQQNNTIGQPRFGELTPAASNNPFVTTHGISNTANGAHQAHQPGPIGLSISGGTAQGNALNPLLGANGAGIPATNPHVPLQPNAVGQPLSGGAEFVNTNNPLESLSGLPYVGFLFGGTTNATRDAAVDQAIRTGNVKGYVGSRSENGGVNPNPIGNILGSTLGEVGNLIGRGISNIPVIGNTDNPLKIGLVSPILNFAFGQIPMTDAQIKRNAIYNFGPRADAFEARGDAYGKGVAEGLRGTVTQAPKEQRIPLLDPAARLINGGLKFVSSFNIPVISFGADVLRSVARGVMGDSAFDFLNSNSRDPMDPSWSILTAPVNVLTSLFGRALAPILPNMSVEAA